MFINHRSKLSENLFKNQDGFFLLITCQPNLHLFFMAVQFLSYETTVSNFSQLIPNVVQYENWTTVFGDHFEVPAATRAQLRKKGHVLQALAGGTICQFIVRNLESLRTRNGVMFGDLIAVSDPRKGGLPAGY